MFGNGGDDNGQNPFFGFFDEGAMRALDPVGTQNQRAYRIQSQEHARERCRSPEPNTKIGHTEKWISHLETSALTHNAAGVPLHANPAVNQIRRIRDDYVSRTDAIAHDRMRAVTDQARSGMGFEGPLYAWRLVPHLPAEVTVPVGTGNQTTVEDVLNPNGVVTNPRLHDPEVRKRRRH